MDPTLQKRNEKGKSKKQKAKGNGTKFLNNSRIGISININSGVA